MPVGASERLETDMVDRNREERQPRRRSDEDGGNEFEERLVKIRRVSKVGRGGRTFSFSSIVVVGDGKGRVGVGIGKAGEVPDSIRKGAEVAKKSMITVPFDGGTIPHEVETTFGASRVLLKPASPGTGVIAGGGVRAVIEVAGVRDILTKSLGSNNPINVVRATIKALQELESEQAVLRRRKRTKALLRKPFDHGTAGISTPIRPRQAAAPLIPVQPRDQGGNRNRRGGQGGQGGQGGSGRGQGGPGGQGRGQGAPGGQRGGQS